MRSSIQRTLAADGTATVSVRGEIDFSNYEELATSVCDSVTDWSPALLLIDLREATFIDSTGLGALIEGFRAAREAGIRFVVTNPSEALRRVLTVTGLSELFGLEPGETTAQEPSQATGA